MEQPIMSKNNKVDQQYCNLLQHIYLHGIDKKDRTGVGTRSVFGRQLRFDMSEGFPLLTSKKIYTKGVIVELLWFLGKHMLDPKYKPLGRTNIRYLVDNNCNIWVGDAYKAYDRNYIRENPPFSGPYPKHLSREEFITMIRTDDKFAEEFGDLGPVYGKQWMTWDVPDRECVDQVDNLLQTLRSSPDSRRMIVNAWNVADLDDMLLPPCHYSFQCYTELLTLPQRWKSLDEATQNFLKRYADDEVKLLRVMKAIDIPTRRLSLMWNQRSVDTPLGLPFNIASYGFLLHMLADLVGMVPGDLIGNLGDTHIYNNQLDGVVKQLAADTHKLPKLIIKSKVRENITDYELSDFVIEDYISSPSISYPLSN